MHTCYRPGNVSTSPMTLTSQGLLNNITDQVTNDQVC